MTRAVLAVLAVLALLAVLPLTAAPAAATRLTGNSHITHKGVGPIRFKMTIGEAREASQRRITRGDEVTKDCRHDRVFPRRFGLDTLTFERHIRVLYVTKPGLATRRGIEVGDREGKLKDTYGDRLHERRSDVSPTTRIFELRRGAREIQFSIFQGHRIGQIATGLQPEVDFSEGCA
jgi:hypothetical protein